MIDSFYHTSWNHNCFCFFIITENTSLLVPLPWRLSKDVVGCLFLRSIRTIVVELLGPLIALKSLVFLWIIDLVFNDNRFYVIIILILGHYLDVCILLIEHISCCVRRLLSQSLFVLIWVNLLFGWIWRRFILLTFLCWSLFCEIFFLNMLCCIGIWKSMPVRTGSTGTALKNIWNACVFFHI